LRGPTSKGRGGKGKGEEGKCGRGRGKGKERGRRGGRRKEGAALQTKILPTPLINSLHLFSHISTSGTVTTSYNRTE